MDEQIIDLHSNAHFMGGALRRRRLASVWVVTYAGRVVKPPFIKAQEQPSEADVLANAIQESESIARRMAAGEIRIPRGVYRFKTLEDADEWMDKLVAQSKPLKD